MIIPVSFKTADIPLNATIIMHIESIADEAFFIESVMQFRFAFLIGDLILLTLGSVRETASAVIIFPNDTERNNKNPAFDFGYNIFVTPIINAGPEA